VRIEDVVEFRRAGRGERINLPGYHCSFDAVLYTTDLEEIGLDLHPVWPGGAYYNAVRGIFFELKDLLIFEQ
jgi:hypothetical protein